MTWTWTWCGSVCALVVVICVLVVIWTVPPPGVPGDAVGGCVTGAFSAGMVICASVSYFAFGVRWVE